MREHGRIQTHPRLQRKRIEVLATCKFSGEQMNERIYKVRIELTASMALQLINRRYSNNAARQGRRWVIASNMSQIANLALPVQSTRPQARLVTSSVISLVVLLGEPAATSRT